MLRFSRSAKADDDVCFPLSFFGESCADGVYCGLGACDVNCEGKLGAVMGVENAMFVAMGAAAMLVVMGAAAMLDVAGVLPIPMLTGILGCCELNKYAFYVYVDKQNKACK